MQAVFADWSRFHRRRLSLRFASLAGWDGQMVGVVTSAGAIGAIPVKCSVSSAVGIWRRLGMAASGNGGVWKWRRLEMAAFGHGIA
ncbi:hypothetical protein N9D23_07185 [Rubripirellula sp.]|nr:hypothetical protein [Rubripirellula sp.]